MDITAQEIPLGELHESPWNPRKHFPQKPLEELAQSMRSVGVLAPLVVRPRPAGGYEIAAGHRRRRLEFRLDKVDQQWFLDLVLNGSQGARTEDRLEA